MAADWEKRSTQSSQDALVYETLENTFNPLRATQNKRKGMLAKRVCLLHDNARNHKTNATKQLMDSFAWETINYNPDLAHSDLHVTSLWSRI